MELWLFLKKFYQGKITLIDKLFSRIKIKWKKNSMNSPISLQFVAYTQIRPHEVESFTYSSFDRIHNSLIQRNYNWPNKRKTQLFMYDAKNPHCSTTVANSNLAKAIHTNEMKLTWIHQYAIQTAFIIGTKIILAVTFSYRRISLLCTLVRA